MTGGTSGEDAPVGLIPGRQHNRPFFRETLQPSFAGYFLMSLAVHTLFVGGILLCGSYAVRSVEPVVVFLAPEPAGGGGGGSRPSEEAKAPHTRVRSAKMRTRKASRPDPAKTVQEQMIPPPVVDLYPAKALPCRPWPNRKRPALPSRRSLR